MACFVCMEDAPPLWTVCGCKSLLVHPHCQAVLISSTPSHRNGCPLCGKTYVNVDETSVLRVAPSSLALILLSSLLLLSLFSLSSWFLYLYFAYRNVGAAYLAGASSAATGAQMTACAYVAKTACRREPRIVCSPPP